MSLRYDVRVFEVSAMIGRGECSGGRRDQVILAFSLVNVNLSHGTSPSIQFPHIPSLAIRSIHRTLDKVKNN